MGLRIPALPFWVEVLLQVIFFAFIILVVYRFLKERVLFKYNPNKWVILAIAGLWFLIPIFLKIDLRGTVWQYLDSTLFIIFFLWFVDLKTLGERNKAENKRNATKINSKNKNNVIIRSKPNPRRAKTSDDESK